jgi:hypothetical protein
MNVYLRFTAFSISLAIIFLVIVYAICYYMLRDGFSTMESSIIGLMTGILFLFISFISSSIFLYNYKKDCLINRQSILKGFYQFALILSLSVIFIIFIDYLYFELIDKSVPIALLNKIRDYLISSGQSEDVVDELAKLPLMTQNGIVVFIGGLVGIPFAIMVSSSFVKNARLRIRENI